MQAIILAAGYATRLYPLTENTAKPLLKVHGKLIIDYILEKIEVCEDISNIYVVTNNKFYNDFVLWQKTAKTSKKITVLNDGTEKNGVRLGAVGDIEFVISKMHINDDISVIAGDNLFSFNIEDIIKYFNKKKATIVAVYDTKDKYLIANRLGCVTLNADNMVTEFEEKPSHPKTTLAATACYVFPKEDLHYVKEALKNRHFDRPGDLIRFIAERESVYGYPFDGYWFDVGTLEEYRRVNSEKIRL